MINIEGNFNFYEELKKQLNNKIDNNAEIIDNIGNNKIETDVNEDKCLITNEKLTQGYVTLLCNHSFNYVPLYNDLVNHKKSLSLETQFLKTNEIRCPYCRNKQSVLIPYYDMIGVKKTVGVNYIKKANTFVGNCNYNEVKSSILLKDYVNMKLNFLDEPNTLLCSNIVSTLSEDGKCYCSIHKRKAKSLFYKIKKYEEKMKLLKEKEGKIKEKTNKKKTITSENVVMNTELCNVILVSGKNKGNQCSKNKCNNDMCKFHYKLYINKDIFNLLDELDDN
jgi:hypothetical protein